MKNIKQKSKKQNTKSGENMEQLVTPQLGVIQYQKQEVIHFSEGLYGFDDLREFLLVRKDPNSLFSYLQPITDVNTTFIVAASKDIIKNYSPKINKADMEKIEAKNDNDIQYYVIITIPKNIEEISANLLGPVIINKHRGIGAQFISQNTEYSTKHKILNQVQSKVS